MKIGKTTRLDFGKCTWLTSVVCSTVFLLNQQASAETVGKNGRFGGITLRYKVILPNGYDPARTYPAVLAFPGGRQTIDGVDSSLDRNWRAEAEGRGYIIVSPAAPSNPGATALTYKSVQVTWQDNSNNEDYFSIQRSTSQGGPFVEIGEASAKIHRFAMESVARLVHAFVFNTEEKVRPALDETADDFGDSECPF